MGCIYCAWWVWGVQWLEIEKGRSNTKASNSQTAEYLDLVDWSQDGLLLELIVETNGGWIYENSNRLHRQAGKYLELFLCSYSMLSHKCSSHYFIGLFVYSLLNTPCPPPNIHKHYIVGPLLAVSQEFLNSALHIIIFQNQFVKWTVELICCGKIICQQLKALYF